MTKKELERENKELLKMVEINALKIDALTTELEELQKEHKNLENNFFICEKGFKSEKHYNEKALEAIEILKDDFIRLQITSGLMMDKFVAEYKKEQMRK